MTPRPTAESNDAVYKFSYDYDYENGGDDLVPRWVAYPIIRVTPGYVYVAGNPDRHQVWRLNRRQLERDGFVPANNALDRLDLYSAAGRAAAEGNEPKGSGK